MNAKLYTAILVALGAAVFGPSAQAGLGKAPPNCTGKNDPSPCLVKGGGGETMVSPHIVRVGQTFTATLESSDGEYGGVFTWQDPFIGGAKLLHCSGKQVHKKGDQWTADKGLGGQRNCTYKAIAPSGGWQIVRFGFNVRYGGLASMDDDALAIVGKGVYYVSGEVRSRPYPGSLKEGTPIRGMTVGVFSAAGRKSGGYAFSKKVTTNNAGFWEVKVPKTGAYDVLPYLRDGDRKVKPKASLEPGTRKVTVTDAKDPEAKFQLDRALGISAELHGPKGGAVITTAKADGLGSGRLVVEVVSPNDDPMANMPIDLKVNGTSGSGAPHAKICDAGGTTRYWPAASWAPSVAATGLKTGADGRLVASVFFGTDPGTLRITASVPGHPTLFDAAEVHMQTDSPLGITPASLAKALWGGMANQASNGWTLDGKAVGLLTSDIGAPVDASRAMAAYLSSVRDRISGVEFAPVQAGPAYGVAFWPSGRVVQTKTGVLDLPASALVIPGTNLGALIQLGKRVGQIVSGYTPQSIPGVEAWRAQAGGGPIRVESAGIPFGLYGGGPYAAGAIAASGCIGN